MVDWTLTERRILERPRYYNSQGAFKKNDSVYAFIQARIGSTRLPGKIYEDINGAPMLYHTIDMAKRAKFIDEVFIVSPSPLPDLPDGVKEFSQGPEEDVLGRYHAAFKANPCDYVVRLTSDCPLLDHHLIDYVIMNSMGFDYGSNVLVNTFPDGMDVEVISASTMEYLNEHATSPYDREHVTTLIRNDAMTQTKLSLLSVQAFKDQSFIKLSVDTQDDLERVRQMERTLKCAK